jgi:patatin-like phospholipase/acyl hydrolase
MKKVLSIDGGGIRGIIPAMVLVEIEKRTGKKISEMFDLVAGTSTGGILALGLTKPNEHGKPQYEALDLVELYEKYGSFIFDQPFVRRIFSLGNLLDEKYPADHLEEVLRRYFHNAELKHATTQVLITSYELEQRIAFFFKSHRAQNEPDRNHLMREIARATSAAPTYFEPFKMKTSDLNEYFALIDGGVFANNPAMCAYVEIKSMFPKEQDFLVVSLGTGELNKPILYNEARNWGVAQWARPILSVVFDGVNDTVDYQLMQLLPNQGKDQRYYRMQIRLDDANNDLDNTTPANIRALKLYAQNLITTNNEALETLCNQLTK